MMTSRGFHDSCFYFKPLNGGLACCYKGQNGAKVAPPCSPSSPTTACPPNAKDGPG